MGTIREIVEGRGATVVGNFSTEGFEFEASKALVDDNHFVGLCVDEDRQPELTEQRVTQWVNQLMDEMCLSELMD